MQSEKPNHTKPLVSLENVKKSHLSQNQYTISLLNDALQIGMLTDKEVYNIQNQLMLILKDLIGRYTQGESSSVSSDTAESIFASILYAIDAYTFQFDDPKKAITYLKTVKVRRVYEKGLGLVRQCFKETEQLYKEINNNKLDVAVEAYNVSIEESVPVFLRKYDIIFDAHNTMASIDYPLAVDDMSIQGVFYLKQYLTRLKMETELCHLFNQEDLQKILINYGKICRFDYRIELFNIFRLIFNNAVFSILSGGNANQLIISANQYKQLYLLFTETNDSQIHSIIHKAIDQLDYDLNINEPKMKNYLKHCGADLIQTIINAVNHDKLQTLIIMEKELKPKSIVTTFKASDRMSDNHFRLLIEKVMGYDKITDKVETIRKNFHSLYDYIDMLNADCLLAIEYEALFSTFGDIELAILAKKVFYEELRNETVDLSSALVKEKEVEMEWQIQFIKFITNMDTERKITIEKYIYDIDYEEINFY
ncbi:DUF6179 domain-containing protein [Virgibacillus salexigens]|uniref:Uncharacterized protein n=1 Tax=Virgibacillus kapii TaxID=1638645 RepID=A0ABQ2E1G1_9BACI|nr:DUF6179 domain-containing protein [Virgibacillus kapii]GGJ76251.1 hypothetical protein GCM10007111_42270 [Virgibacillus kapii]